MMLINLVEGLNQRGLIEIFSKKRLKNTTADFFYKLDYTHLWRITKLSSNQNLWQFHLKDWNENPTIIWKSRKNMTRNWARQTSTESRHRTQINMIITTYNYHDPKICYNAIKKNRLLLTYIIPEHMNRPMALLTAIRNQLPLILYTK